MRYQILGRSGVRVSEVALGTLTFGEDWGFGVDRTTSARLLDVYAEAGGNFIDTANFYTDGDSERIVGELLRGRRDQFVLATKFTVETRTGDPNSAGNHRKSLTGSLEASLRRLGTDHIDLLWVHARDTLTPVPELMRVLDDQVRLGKVGHVGVSNWPAWEIAQANTLAELRDWSPFVGLQTRYNLLERSVERELIPMANGLGIPVFAWGALAEGRLTGKYLDGGQGRLTTIEPEEHSKVGSDEVVREVVKIAEEGGWTPAQVALAWLIARPGVVVPILGATRESQLADNLGATAVRLDDAQLARLDDASRPVLGFPQDMLRQEVTIAKVYGDRWRDIVDRRTVGARGINDGLHPAR
ncbi:MULTISPECIES: aldo/keto reductase [Catenuloplanes]|uniref:Aryl-alcohol dehydrogenase-like predicted oxidoreductase n=1 Tax=Catenuloplanes niger TaxID=587534 RepID=A0AAE4A0Y2_9ACTN|nr:aldo/keto reductase [Catenuloplanes niger]MDR7327578.1 aryl-alcohol dehydrogenase-like predicted oxidoreductase [Catenuloplanes niger]